MALTSDGNPTSVHRKILALLAGLSLVSYVLRTNISVAARFMMPELGLNEIQMGQVFSSFMLGYAIFQIPAGWLGDRKGPRIVLTVAALLWGAMTLLTGLLPGLLVSGTGALISLLVLRFTLGAAEAATYPVAARAVANWMPASERAFANAVVIAGSTVGWGFTFAACSALAVIAGLIWLFIQVDQTADEKVAEHIEELNVSATSETGR